MDKKAGSNYMLIQQVHIRSKNKSVLKVKGWSNIFHANTEKRTGAPTLISKKKKIDFKSKIVTLAKEGQFIMIKV